MPAENTQNNSEHTIHSYDVHPELLNFVKDALEAGDKSRVRELISDLHAADIAEIIRVVNNEQREQFVAAIRSKFNPEVLVELESGVKEEVIGHLGITKSVGAITQLDADDAVQVIEDLEKKEQAEILERLPDEQREELEEGLAYPEETAGRLMDRDFVAVPMEWTVGKIIDFLRQNDSLPDDFYSIFVVNKENKPVGYALVSRVIRSNRDVRIRDIMEEKVHTIRLDMDQEEIAYVFQKYALASAPIIDENGVMKAVITLDDVVTIIEEEAEEDIMKMGGVSGTDLYAAFMETAAHRFPWLFVNLLTAIAASAVIAVFEDSIEKLVALAVLMPIVASMAGNAGTQTLTIAVRAIATRELTAANSMRIVGKEVKASLVNGIVFGLIVAVVSLIFYDNTYLSFVFAVATLVSLVIAAFAGATIPLLLVRMGVDPAVASSVFLTTVTDMSAFFVFLGMAAWILV